jgi:hypothetical protein
VVWKCLRYGCAGWLLSMDHPVSSYPGQGQ